MRREPQSLHGLDAHAVAGADGGAGGALGGEQGGQHLDYLAVELDGDHALALPIEGGHGGGGIGDTALEGEGGL